MKAFTDISQSKKLAEILPLESADMYYLSEESLVPKVIYNGMVFFNSEEEKLINSIYCWSLAALLGVVPYLSLHKTFSGWRCDSYNKEGTSCILGVPADNPVDACYEMILKLHELNLL